MIALRRRSSAALLAGFVLAALPAVAPEPAAGDVVIGATVDHTIEVDLTCERGPEGGACPVSSGGSLSASQRTASSYVLASAVETSAAATLVPLTMTSMSHTARRVSVEGIGCRQTSTEVDGPSTFPPGGAPGGATAVVEELVSGSAPELKLTDAGPTVDGAQPASTRTFTSRGDCAPPTDSTEQVFAGRLIGQGRAVFGLNPDVLPQYSRATLAACRAGEPCTRRFSGTTRIGRRVPGADEWGEGGSGSFTVTDVFEWTLEVRPGTLRDDPRDDTSRPRKPRIVDSYCTVGSAIGDYSAGFASLLDSVSTSGGNRALGPIGIGLGVIGLACTASDLWDEPIDSDTEAFAVGACAGLSTFSFGVGVFSAGAAGTVVGLPAAAVGGLVSLGTGGLASLACAYDDYDGFAAGPVRRARAAQAGDPATVPAARPVRMRLPRLPRGTPAGMRRELRAMATTIGRAGAAGTALRTCLAQARTATAAGDLAAASRQRTCAAREATTLAGAFRAHAEHHRRLARAARRGGLRDRPIDRAKARRSAAKLPTAAKRALARARVSTAAVAVLQRLGAQRVRTLPIPRTLAAALGDRRARTSLLAAARRFDALAERQRAAAGL